MHRIATKDWYLLAGMGFSVALHIWLAASLHDKTPHPQAIRPSPVHITVVHNGPAHIIAKMPLVAAPIPKIVPKRPLPKKIASHKVAVAEKPLTQEPVAPSSAIASSQATGQSTRSAGMAVAPAAPIGDGSAKASYLGELRARIESNKEYPQLARSRRQTCRVEVTFLIVKSGAISNIEASGCPFESLKEAAIAAVSKVGHVKPIPVEFGRQEWKITVPINFTLES